MKVSYAHPERKMVPVPLRPAHGFRMQAEDIAARITPRSRRYSSDNATQPDRRDPDRRGNRRDWAARDSS